MDEPNTNTNQTPPSSHKQQQQYSQPSNGKQEKQMNKQQKQTDMISMESRYKIGRLQSYRKFDIKGVIRLHRLQQKQKQLINSYSLNKNKMNKSYSSNAHNMSKKPKLDMIIPSLQAFNLTNIGLLGMTQFKQEETKVKPNIHSRQLYTTKKYSSTFRNNVTQKQELGFFRKEQASMRAFDSKDLDDIRISQPIQLNKNKITAFNSEREFYSAKKVYFIGPRNIKQREKQQQIPNKRNIENILRRKSNINFQQIMLQYCRRLKINQNSKIFIFQSSDVWIKQALIERGWILNEDAQSCIFHLKWTYKVSKTKCNENQMINHFYQSDSITSKEGLSKVAKQSHFLSRSYPRSYDLGSQMRQFLVNFQQTQILCGFKKIIQQIQKNNLAPQIILKKQQLKTAFKNLKQSQNFQQFHQIHSLTLHIPYAVQLCAYCQILRCKTQQDQFQPSNILNQKSLRYLQNFSLLSPPYNQYINQFSNPNKSQTQQKIRFNKDNINMYTSSSSFKKPSLQLIQIIYSYHSYLCINYKTYEAEGHRNIWIVKNRNSSKGIGISLSNNLQQILKRTQNKLVQKYIQNCCLYKSIGEKQMKYKFDLRVWVLVTSFKPLIAYFYKQFYCRLCSQPYDFYDLHDLQKHLTNYSRNKQVFESDNRSSIITYQQFINMMQQQMKIDQNTLKNQINTKLTHLIFHTLKQYQQLIKSHPQNFQLFGFDILVSPPLNLLLLQVNLSPACQDRNQWLSKNVRNMGKSLINIIVDHISPQAAQNQGWVLVNNF